METERLGARGTWIERFRRLLDRIDGEGPNDPRFAVVLAERAVDIARKAPAEVSTEAVWRALAIYGGALRFAERFVESKAAALASWSALHAGRPVSRADEAELCGRLAFLLRDLRECEEAKVMADRKVQLAQSPQEKAKALLDLCLVLWDAGDADWASIRENGRRALALLDPVQEPAYYRAALQMVLVGSAEDETFAEAGLEALLRQYCKEETAQPGSYGYANQLWIVGLVTRRLGQADQARGAFQEAQSIFLSLSNHVRAAVVTMELAILELESGRNAEVLRLAGELFPFFQAVRHRSREAWASLALFCQAALEGRLTAGAAKQYKASFLRQASREGQ
ncbi:MAG: hypothetical protein AAGN66_11080 [Acidobacteriota bacterium]